MGAIQVKNKRLSEPSENIHSVSEIEVHYKKPKLQLPTLDNAKNVHIAFMKIWPKSIEHREEAYVFFADNALNPLGFYNVGKGGVNACPVDARLIFQIALKVNASFIFLAHNHPSGVLKPSDSDIRLTSDLVDKGRFLGIEIKDHLIVSAEKYFSFAEKRYL